MKTPDHTGATRRADQPASIRAGRDNTSEPASPVPYVARGMRTTFLSFTVPTILAPFLPAPLQPLRLLACGAIYADQQMQPSDIRFHPQPSRRRQSAGILVSLLPFIPAFAIQAYLTETWCANPSSWGGRMAAASQHAWSRFCQRLPHHVGAVALRYPVNFVLARFAAQMAAVTTGSLLALCYHRMRGSQLVTRPRPLPSRSLRERLQSRPDAYAIGAAPFILPAVLDSRFGRALLQAPGVPRALCGLVITTSLVGAALVTAVVGTEQRS
jgi:hypothetical protein